MTAAEVLLFASLLPISPAGGLVVPSEVANQVPPAIHRVAAESVPLVRPDQILVTSGPDAQPSKQHGWSRLTKLLVAEASIAALSSAGHLAEAFGKPPNDGAEALGVGLLGIGGLFAAIVPMGLADSDKDARGNVKTFLVGCAALMVAGGYDLYLSKHNDGGGARVFRHNMISLNGVWVVTWGISRWRHW